MGSARWYARSVAPRPVSAPIPLVLHGDVLDPWCWIAEQRIATAADELHGRFQPLAHAPMPRRWEPRAPTPAERRTRIRELKRAALEPGAPAFTAELWSGPGTGPQSSAPALVAVAAACMQGLQAEQAMRHALREAALVVGVDVSRTDVIVEVAARAGLDLARFIPAFEASGTARAVREDVDEARDLGVRFSPSLVINEDWLVTGLRSLRDYRTLLRRYLADRAGSPVEHTMH